MPSAATSDACKDESVVFPEREDVGEGRVEMEREPSRRLRAEGSIEPMSGLLAKACVAAL